MTDHPTEAHRWLALRSQGGRLSVDEARAFDQWLAQGANRADYERVEQLYREAGEAGLFSQHEIRQTLEATALAASRRRRSLATWSGWRHLAQGHAATMIAATAVVALAFVFWLKAPPRVDMASYETRRGEHRLVQLSDGSSVELDASTRFSTAFSSKIREVRAFEGRALFSVEGDAARPFIIATGNARVRVVGTQFQVDRTPDRVEIAVLHGVVEVVPGPRAGASDGGTSVVLQAGQRVTVSERGEVSPVAFLGNDAEFAAWRTGRIEFRGRALHEVVAEAARYFDGVIVIRDDAVRALQISGSFKTAEPVDFLTTLELIAPVEVVRVNAGLIEIRARR